MSNPRIFVAGHRGLVGSAMVRLLTAIGYEDLILRTRGQLDLADQREVGQFFASERPGIVILAAAKVGGIHANDTYPADFLTENLLIQTNVITAARHYGTEKLLFLGSSCIYPRDCEQPIKEECLLTGPLEKTNEAYAIAKIAGLKLCAAIRKQEGRHFFSVMPCNLYGPNDRAGDNGHVIPSLMTRILQAKRENAPSVTIWGSGWPLREFLHVDDLARALLLLLNTPNVPDVVNVGSGEEVTIRHLAVLIVQALGYEGEMPLDLGRPDGTPRKIVDSSYIRSLGWSPKIDLADGLRSLVNTVIS